MDRPPYRASQARPAARPNQASQGSAAAPAATQATVAHRAAAPSVQHSTKHAKKDSKRPLLWIIIAVVSVLLLAGGGWFALQKLGVDTGVDNGKYQMVFLNNGSAYFGKLEHVDQQYLKLTKVFYIQTNEATTEKDAKEAAQQEGGDMQLIKLGNEVYGPEDELRISRDQVTFYGNINPDGKVAKLIEQYKK